MAELTSGLTSVVFSPYSKMFIGGLSWQTSPGETVILFYSMSRDFLLFCVAVDWVLVCRLASACLPAWCLLWRCMCECAPYCMGYLTRVCAHDVIFDLRPSEVLYSTPKRIAGCFFSFSLCVCVCVCFCCKCSDNSMPICSCQNDPTSFLSLFSIHRQP